MLRLYPRADADPASGRVGRRPANGHGPDVGGVGGRSLATWPRRPAAIEWWYALTHPGSARRPPSPVVRGRSRAARRVVVARAARVGDPYVDRRPGPRHGHLPRHRRVGHRRDRRRRARRRSRPTTMRRRSAPSRRWGSCREGAASRNGSAGASDGPLAGVAGCRTATASARWTGRTSSQPASALHRAAFPKSALNVSRSTSGCSPCRTTDSRTTSSSKLPDGELAAFALGWWDPDGGVAEFEPVGTHPDHQRRGLSRALLTAGLIRFFEAGASTVQVYSDASEDAAEALYASAGFHRRAFHQRYARRSDDAPEGTIGT